MICNNCNKREASVYYKQNINGSIKEYALCPECAAKLNVGLDNSAVHNLFGSFFFPYNGTMPKEVKKCTLCSSSFEDIRRSGKVGCAECYEVFKKELEPMVSNIHGRALHRGRGPGNEEKKEEKTADIQRLKQELQAAIEAEEYEKAAKIRDEIREKEGCADER